VTLFGGIAYLVDVSDNYEEGSSPSFSIFFDSPSKRQFNPIVLEDEMSLIDRVLSGRRDIWFRFRLRLPFQR
jgi:hypothetical protein